MATGIPFLDNLISGVNNAASSISTAINNTSQYLTTTTAQAQTQLGQFIGGISNTIGAITNGITNQVAPVQQTYAPTIYNPYSNAVVQYQTPLQAPGTTYAPSVYAPYSGQYAAYQMPPQLGGQFTANVSLQGFDFNTVYAAVNAAFQQLPNIIATINNPLNSPYLQMLQPLFNQLIVNSNQATQSIRDLIQHVETELYQSTSGALRNVGIDVQGWSNLLDASVRTVMEQLGYDFNQRMSDIKKMNDAGLADVNQKIYNTQQGINQLLQQLTYTTDVIKKQQDTLANTQGIGATVPPKDLISLAVDEASTALIKTLKEALDYAAKDPNNFFTQFSKRIDGISNVIDELKAGKFKSPDELFLAMFGNEPSSGLARTLVILASVIPTLISAVNMAGEPALNSFNQLVNEASPVKLLSPSDYMTAYFKGQISYDYLLDKVKKQGISEETLKTLLDAAIVDPDYGTMIQAKRRGFLKPGEWSSYLTDQRLDSRSAEIIEQVLKVLPNVQDLTRIADKRVWSEKLDAKYGQFAELPDNYRKYMEQQGFDPEFTEWIWASHWELPSPQQIFEMYQRDVINPDDMKAYLALTDWLPFFRDKLLSISYNPLTRVDIRRMYGLGMFSYDELVKRYRYIGFSPADAKLMADFTVKYEGDSTDSEIDKLKAKIVTAIQGLYVRGKLTADEAVNRLVSLGKDRAIAQTTIAYLNLEKSIESTPVKLPDYKTKAINLIKQAYLAGTYPRIDAYAKLLELGLSDFEAGQELQYLDLEKQVKTKQDIIVLYETRYLNGIDTQATLIANLAQAGLNNFEINSEVTEAETKLQKKFKMPTEKQVQTWFKDGNISAEYVYNYLKFVGYPDDIIPTVLLGDFGIAL